MRKSSFPVLLLFFLLSVGVVLVSQKQQELRTTASANTTLQLLPSTSINAPLTKRVGDRISFDVMLYPGSNYITTVKVHISYDASVFEVPQRNGFEINKKAFPFAIEGPIINNDDGSVIATFFVGADPSQAIKVPTKVGTLHLTALRETYNLSTSKIFFEETSQAYSVASQDYAYENVIATTTPAYVVVRPRDAAIPLTPLPQGSEGQASYTVTPAPIVVHSVAPTVTVAPTHPPKELKISFKTFLTGIGKKPLENTHPKRTTRYAKMFLVNAKNFVTTSYDVALRYEESDGSFVGTLIVPDIDTGMYKVQMKVDGYLLSEFSESKFLAVGSEYFFVPVRLFAGDVNNDGRVSVVDYNLMLSCSIIAAESGTCSKQARILADLDDNGRVDENDQFIFIKQNE